MRWIETSLTGYRWPLAAAVALAAYAVTAGATDAAPLVGNVWAWQSTQLGEGRSIAVARPAHYTIEFAIDGSLRVRADCNRGGGRYALDGIELSIGPIATTKRGCGADTQDRDFLAGLEQVARYRLEAGELVLALRSGSESMRFTRLAR